jgi:hypothetical protein
MIANRILRIGTEHNETKLDTADWLDVILAGIRYEFVQLPTNSQPANDSKWFGSLAHIINGHTQYVCNQIF